MGRGRTGRTRWGGLRRRLARRSPRPEGGSRSATQARLRAWARAELEPIRDGGSREAGGFAQRRQADEERRQEPKGRGGRRGLREPSQAFIKRRRNAANQQRHGGDKERGPVGLQGQRTRVQ